MPLEFNNIGYIRYLHFYHKVVSFRLNVVSKITTYVSSQTLNVYPSLIGAHVD